MLAERKRPGFRWQGRVAGEGQPGEGMSHQELLPRLLPSQPPVAFSFLRPEQSQVALEHGRLADPFRAGEPDVRLILG